MEINRIHKDTMTAKERVRRTFAFEKTDRVTIGYEANGAIHNALCNTLGVPTNDYETLLRKLSVDYRGIGARYTGPKLFEDIAGRHVDPLEGFVTKWIEHSTGGYWDFCDFPLTEAEDEAFDTYPMPNPDDFDYDGALASAKNYNNEFGLHIGHAGMADVINSNGRLMGMEDVLCHLITENEAALAFIQRRAKWQLGMFERLLDKCHEHLDFVWLGEDLGTQHSPMISLELYRKILKPIHKSFVDAAAAYKLPAIVHTCGSSSWVYEDFIDIGIRGVDTLQPEATNMSPEYLVKQFGGRLNFRGCISTTGDLAYGTPQSVDEVCRETLEIMMPTHGFHFAPTHMIQDNSPVENVVSMYNAVQKYGFY